MSKCVYRHSRSLDGEVFYIGMGNSRRPYQTSGRNVFWNNYVNKYGDYKVEVLCDKISRVEAVELEKSLISYYGRRIKGNGTLVNISSGGTFGSSGYGGDALKKEVICLDSGIVYESIKEYCNAKKSLHSTISTYLRGENKNSEHNVRFVENNKIKWDIPNIPNIHPEPNLYLEDIPVFSVDYDYETDKEIEHNLCHINNEIKKLSYIDKKILNLHTNGCSFSEISRITNTPKSNIYSRYCYLIKKIKNNVQIKDSPKPQYTQVIKPQYTQVIVLTNHKLQHLCLINPNNKKKVSKAKGVGKRRMNRTME